MLRLLLITSLLAGPEIYDGTLIYPDQLPGGNVATGLSAEQVCTQTADDTTPGIGTGFGPLGLGCNILVTSDTNTGATAITTLDGAPPTVPGTPGSILYIIGPATAANPTTIADAGNFELERDWSAPLTGSETRILVLECLAADTFVEVGRHNGERYFDNDIETGDGDIFAALGVALDLYSSATSTAASTNNVNVSTGNATNAGDYNSGAVAIFTGTSTTLGDSGGVSTYSGNAADTSGSISVYSGTSAGAGENSGSINIYSGNQTSATGSNSGVISIRSGSAAGTSNSGSMSFFTGTQTNVGDYQSGPINIYTGTSATLGDTGFVAIRSGDAADASGDIEIYSGTSANTGESSGGVSFYSGNQTHATGGASGSFSIHSGDAAGTGLSGGISMYTGSQSNVGDVDSGDILVYTGATTTDGDSGDITYQTGAAGAGAADAGDIVFQTHGANTRLTISGDGTAVVFGTTADLDGNTLYYDQTNDADTYTQWVSADRKKEVVGGLTVETSEASLWESALQDIGSDAATQPRVIRGMDGYGGATGANRDGGWLHLLPGNGTQSAEITAWGNCAGNYLNVADGTIGNQVLTEGVDWTASVDEATSLLSLKSAVDALATVRSEIVGTVLHIYPEGVGHNLASSTDDATCMTVVNDPTQGWVRLGKNNSLDFSGDGGEYIIGNNSAMYIRAGSGTSTFTLNGTDIDAHLDIDLNDAKSVFVGGTTSFGGNDGWNQAGFGTGTADGYHIVIGLYDPNVKNYDHGTGVHGTNPALYVHSVEDPDTENQEFVGMYHDTNQAVFVTGTGYGGYKFVDDSGKAAATYVDHKTESVTFAGNPGDASKVTTGSIIPAGAFVVGVSTRVVTAATNCTDVDIGIAGTDTDMFADGTAVADTTTTTNADKNAGADWVTIQPNATAQEITVTANGGNCYDGVWAITVHFLDISAATAD